MRRREAMRVAQRCRAMLEQVNEGERPAELGQIARAIDVGQCFQQSHQAHRQHDGDEEVQRGPTQFVQLRAPPGRRP